MSYTLFLNNLILFIILFAFFSQTDSQRIRIRFAQVEQQDQFVYRMFNDDQKQFYADIGAFDPYSYSLTTSLYLKRWKGLHLDGGYERLVKFFDCRPSTINIPMVVDSQNSYFMMIDANEDSSSSINKDYFKYQQQNRGQYFKEVKHYLMPSISLKDICQRYYLVKPVFMNLDVQGNQGKALQSNNWQNQKCRPDVIMLQEYKFNNNENVDIPRFGQVSGQDVLSKNKYKIFPQRVAQNQIWIEQQKFNYYFQKLNKQSKKYNSMEKIYYVDLVNTITYQLTGAHSYLIHYSVIYDYVYFHFSLNNEYIVLQDLYEEQQRRTNHVNLNHPIVVLEFNPFKSKILVKDKTQYTIQDYQIAMDNGTLIHFWHVALKKNQIDINIYIMDHEYQGKNSLSIQKVYQAYKPNKNELYQTINTIVNGFLFIMLLVILYLAFNEKSSYQVVHKDEISTQKKQEQLSQEQQFQKQSSTNL